MSRINRQAAREDATEGHVLVPTDTLRLLDELDVATDILVRLVQQANAQKFQGNVELDGDGFIASYRMPCGPVHGAIAYLQGVGIVVDEFGSVRPHEGE